MQDTKEIKFELNFKNPKKRDLLFLEDFKEGRIKHFIDELKVKLTKVKQNETVPVFNESQEIIVMTFKNLEINYGFDVIDSAANESLIPFYKFKPVVKEIIFNHINEVKVPFDYDQS